MADQCTHLNLVKVTTSDAEGCEECLKIGDSWVHLRLCLICGKVGCCDNSKNKHATKHFQEVGHALIKSYQPGEEWVYCYLDELLMESLNS